MMQLNRTIEISQAKKLLIGFVFNSNPLATNRVAGGIEKLVILYYLSG